MAQSPQKNAFALLMSNAKNQSKSPPRKRKIDDSGDVSGVNKLTKLEEDDKIHKIPLEQQKEMILEKIKLPTETFKTDEDYYHYYRDVLAPFLLNEVELVVNGNVFYIREIEFYFTCNDHNDPFTHCTEIQGKCALWYFHRNGKLYRSGTYKGLDISIGQEGIGKGGILIRSLEQVKQGASNRLFCGPCVLVDQILKVCGVASIDELVENKMRDDISIFGGDSEILKLQLSLHKREHDVHHSARVGIHMTKRGVARLLQERYVYRPYRSFTQPKSIFKGKNLMVLELIKEGYRTDQICEITGATIAIVNGCIAAFKKGAKDRNEEEFFGRRLLDNEIALCFGALVEKQKSSHPPLVNSGAAGNGDINNNNNNINDSNNDKKDEIKCENGSENEDDEKEEIKEDFEDSNTSSPQREENAEQFESPNSNNNDDNDDDEENRESVKEEIN